MATLFWVGGSTAYDGTTNRLATTSGGSATVAVIASGDTVTFDANSPAAATVTTSAAISCTTLSLASGFTGSLTMSNTLTVSGTITLTQGTLNTNGQTCSFGTFNSSGAIARTLTLGASAITCSASGTAWNCVTATSLAVTSNTATVTLSGSGSQFSNGSINWNGLSVVLSGGGTAVWSGSSSTVANLTRTGTAGKNDVLSINATTATITSAFTVNGADGINRLLLQSSAIGTARTITAGSISAQYLDVQDITAPGAGWSLSGITGNSGDCGGNTGITFTSPSTQHFTNTNGGTWSTVGNWTSRIPLPQDTVIIDAALGASKTITADMNRIGKDITITQSVAFTFSGGGTFFGSFTQDSHATWTAGSFALFATGRSTHTITTAGVSVPHSITFQAFGGTYTLQDNWTISGTAVICTLNNGTLDLNGKNLTVARLVLDGVTTTRALTTSGGTITCNATTGTLWACSVTTGLTLTVSAATISFSDTTSGAKTFAGGAQTYGTFRCSNLGGAALTISGNNSFGTLDLECTTASTVTLPASGIQTITSNLILKGASGQLLSLVSSTPTISTALTLTGPSSNLNGFISLSTDIALTPIIAASGGGNWSATSTWVKAVVPTAADNVQLGAGSGAVTIDVASVCRSLECTAYTNTLTHTAAIGLTVGDATAGLNNVALRLGASMTYTLGNAATSALSFISTSATVQTITSNSKTLGSVTFNPASNGSWQLADAMTIGTTATLTHSAGTLDTNNKACSWGLFVSNSATARTITMGSSAITISGSSTTTWTSNNSSLTVTANTSTITFSGATYTISKSVKSWATNWVLAGSGVRTFNGTGSETSMTVTGASALQERLDIVSAFTLTGLFTATGANAGAFRLQVQRQTPVAGITVTVGTVSLTNVDFQSVTAAGNSGSAWTGTSLGDKGGNSNITFDASVAQAWNSTSGGNWSDASKWTTRVPLPQDDVTVNQTFVSTPSITVDVITMGRNLTLTGGAAWNLVGGGEFTGNITFGSNCTSTAGGQASGWVSLGRGSQTITTNGISVRNQWHHQAPGGTLTLQDSFTVTSSMAVVYGTLDLNGQNLTASAFFSYGAQTRQVTIGSSSFNLTNTVNTGVLVSVTQTAGLTISATTGGFVATNSTANVPTFTGSGFSFPSFTATSGGSFAFLDSNTFTSLDIETATARTLTFTASTTQTMTNFCMLKGSSGQLLSLRSSTPTTAYTLNMPGGTTGIFLDLQDCTSTNPAKAIQSTDSLRNSNWVIRTKGDGNLALSGAGG